MHDTTPYDATLYTHPHATEFGIYSGGMTGKDAWFFINHFGKQGQSRKFLCEGSIGKGAQAQNGITILQTDAEHITISTDELPITIREKIVERDTKLQFMTVVEAGSTPYRFELPKEGERYVVVFEWKPYEAVIFVHGKGVE